MLSDVNNFHTCGELGAHGNRLTSQAEKGFHRQQRAPDLPCEDGVRVAVPAGDLK